MKNQKTYETAQVVEANDASAEERNRAAHRVARKVDALMELSEAVRRLAERLNVDGTEKLTEDEKRIVRMAMLPQVNEIMNFAKVQYVSGAELGDICMEIRQALEQL